MPEKFGIKIGAERESDRRVMQVTHRDYKGYLYAFNLPEESLANAGVVVDVGAGLSTFSKEAREKFKGLRAIAIDPIYDGLKSDRYKTMDEFENSEGIFFDFDPSYRGEEKVDDLELDKQKKRSFFARFKHMEVLKHPDEYLAASHQDLPLQDKSADLVLACNSVLRSENSPQAIERAIRECLRVAKDNGEIRIAGAITCLVPKEKEIELWYNGELAPGSPQAEEFQRTGHYSDPELMSALAGIDADGANFYCVVKSVPEGAERKYRFDTLIIRRDEQISTLDIETEDAEDVQTELRRMEFAKNDGFNIPTVETK